MNTNKIREALTKSRRAWDVSGRLDMVEVMDEALAELDAAPKVLTDEEIERLCNTPFPRFSDVLYYVRDNGCLAPSVNIF